MTVDDKMTESKFFLDKLTSTDPADEDSVHYLSAFLSASRSIMSQLLRDSAKKYGLGVGDDQPLDSSSLRDRAQSKGVKDAVAFIDAYDQSVARLEENGYYEVLALRRNINVNHGAHPLIHNLSIMTQETIDDSDTLTVRDERDPAIAMSPGFFHRPTPEPETGSSDDFSFEDFPDESVPHVCAVYLAAIQDEVAKLRTGH